jgi:YHS domain-containing protein
MKKTFFFSILCLVVAIGCHKQNSAAAKETVVKTSPAAEMSMADQPFKNVKFDNTNDFVCGCPLAAGVGDSVHYRGKVYGFCSKECKDKFLMNPAQYIAAQ